MPKVSVIIPVYGVEEYIERCVRSLFEQTLDDLEYLFIDDCTSDKSIEILIKLLDEYPQRKNQVVIHRMEHNSGQAKVREWGMSNVTGEYVIHCDSDDWVDKHMYEEMYKKAVEDNADIVVCGYYKSDGFNCESFVVKNIPPNKDIFLRELLCHTIEPAVWNKLVRSECYKNKISYPVHNMGEDLALMIQIFYFSEKISYIKKPYYFYYLNTGSITGDCSFENVVRRVYQLKENVDFIINFLNNQFVGNCYKRELMHLKFFVKCELCQCSEKGKIGNFGNDIYPECSILNILQLRKISIRAKLLYVLYRLGVYHFLKNIKRKYKR